jgi:hypothetical protein
LRVSLRSETEESSESLKGIQKMSSITITIKIDVPEGSSVNVGHESGEPVAQSVQAEVAETVEAPKPKKRKKAATKSEPVADAEEPSVTTASELPAPSAEQPESSESTPETSETGTSSSESSASASKAEGDVKELLATVLTMLKSGRIHEDKAVAKEMIKEVSRTFGVDTVPQVPREKWGEYMIALDAKISERSVA